MTVRRVATKNLPLPDCYAEMEQYRQNCIGRTCGFYGRCSYVSRLFRN